MPELVGEESERFVRSLVNTVEAPGADVAEGGSADYREDRIDPVAGTLTRRRGVRAWIRAAVLLGGVLAVRALAGGVQRAPDPGARLIERALGGRRNAQGNRGGAEEREDF